MSMLLMTRERDPDALLVALFRNHAVLDEAKTAQEGRPIYEDIEVVEIRAPGSRNFSVHPATAISHWSTDALTGAQVKVTYAERFARQYRQFKEQAQQTKTGTPLAHAPFLTEARRAELRALSIYTVEQLAAVDGQELKNLGSGGRDLKNRAEEYIAESKANVPNVQLQHELEALRARNAVLEEDNEALKQARAAAGEGPFADMSDQQLREYITTNTGHAPQGNLSRKVLLRMATETRPKVA